jgi:hypothetical protein
MNLTERTERAATRLAEAVDACDHCGWDPYDALSSPLVRTLARGRLARGAAIQALKRSPVNVRPLVGVRPRRHTKGLALFASAYARLDRLGLGAGHLARARALAHDLVARAVPAGAGAGWAYDFDVQTRWAFYPAGQPNAVVTTFVAHALLDVADATGDDELREVAHRALPFARERLVGERDGERFYVYFPGATTPIHNANLLVAGLFARCSSGDDDLAIARDAVGYSLARQRPDGTWPYGEGHGLEWVDGFHTAYNLDALALWDERTRDARGRAALESGLDAYVERLFDEDGAPRATTAARHPIDIHAASSAIGTLSRLRERHPAALATAARVLDWTLRTMSRRDGRFAFQRHARRRISVPYVRWSDGHMLVAMASYLEAAR